MPNDAKPNGTMLNNEIEKTPILRPFWMFDTELCARQLYAIRFYEGTNFEIVNNECEASCHANHLLQMHVAILKDKSGNWSWVGYCFICKTCMKYYLLSDESHTISADEYPDYSFMEWIIRDSVQKGKRDKRIKECEVAKEWIKEFSRISTCSLAKAQKIAKYGFVPGIRVNKGEMIHIGTRFNCGCDAKPIRCGFMLINKAGKEMKGGLGFFAQSVTQHALIPLLKKQYRFPLSQIISL